MVFDTGEATVYRIRSQHRNEEVRELVLGDYAGTLVTDRGPNSGLLISGIQSETNLKTSRKLVPG